MKYLWIIAIIIMWIIVFLFSPFLFLMSDGGWFSMMLSFLSSTLLGIFMWECTKEAFKNIL
jgi:hypothetical protein